MQQLADETGYKTASGIQRYESTETYKEHYFDVRLVHKLAPALVGRGNPPIQEDEFYLELSGTMPRVRVNAGPGGLPDRQGDSARPQPQGTAEIRQSDYVDLLSPRKVEWGRKDLPLFGQAKGSFDGAEIDYLTPVTYVERPPQLVGVQKAAAVLVTGDSMEPRYFAGEELIVDPRAAVRAGAFVVVEMKDHVGIVKQLVRRTDSEVRLRQLNPPAELVLKRADVVGIYKIVGTWERGF